MCVCVFSNREKVGRVSSSSPVAEEISGPIVLDRYVAVADYEKQKKNECNLSAGQMVEVIDKNQNGWWFVSLDNFNEGWVPATYLDPLYGTEDAQVEVFAPGQGLLHLTHTLTPSHSLTYRAVHHDQWVPCSESR